MKLPTPIRRIAVFRALQLGDMLCAVPAFRALRHAYPDAEITLLGLPWARDFCERFNQYFDEFIHFPGYPGLPEQPFGEDAWQRFTEEMRSRPYDLILQMQGNGSIVNEMLKSLNAGPVAGFHSAGNEGDPELFVTYPDNVSEIERHLKLLEKLGIRAQGLQLEFPIRLEEADSLHRKMPGLLRGRYVCVHPGSRGAWRQWPPSHFACVADQCVGMGFQVIVTGTEAERNITQQVIEAMDYPATDLTGRTSTGEVAELISKSAMLISNCTGVSHMAAATRTPSIVISMDGEPGRWAPLNHDLHKTFDWTVRQDFDAVQTAALELLLKHEDVQTTVD